MILSTKQPMITQWKASGSIASGQRVLEFMLERCEAISIMFSFDMGVFPFYLMVAWKPANG